MVGVAFCVAGAISAVSSDAFISSTYWVVNVGFVLVAVALSVEQPLLRDRAKVHRVVITVALIVAVITLTEQARRSAVLNGFYLQALPGYQPGGGAFRPSSFIGNALVTSTVLAVMYAFALVSPALGRRRPLILIVLGAAVLSTLSRSSIATIVIVTILHIVGPSGRRKRLRIAALAVPAFVYGLNSISALLALRSGGKGYIGTSQTIRAARAADAFEVFRAHPLFGVGLGGVKRYLRARLSADQPAAADNMYLTLLAEIGVIGILILIYACWHVWAVRSSNVSALPLIALLVNGFAFEFLYHDAVIILVGYLIADMAFASRVDRIENHSSRPKLSSPL